MEQRRTLFINSKDRTSGNFNDYTVDVNINDTFFQLDQNEQLFVMPTRFSVLNDFDNVNGYNNTFVLKITDLNTLAETDYTITADIGIYTSYTFQTEIQNQLNAFFTAQGIAVACVITFDDDKEQYIYTFTATSSTYFDNYEYIFVFNDIETSLANFMGFADGEYIASSSSGDTAVFNSYKSVNMVFQPEIQIHTSLVFDNYQTSQTGAKSTEMFFSVNQGAKGDFITFENPSELFKSNCATPFGSINIRYLDNENRPVLFQSDSRLSLTFIKVKQITTENNILEVLKEIEALSRLDLLSKQFGLISQK